MSGITFWNQIAGIGEIERLKKLVASQYDAADLLIEAAHAVYSRLNDQLACGSWSAAEAEKALERLRKPEAKVWLFETDVQDLWYEYVQGIVWVAEKAARDGSSRADALQDLANLGSTLKALARKLDASRRYGKD